MNPALPETGQLLEGALRGKQVQFPASIGLHRERSLLPEQVIEVSLLQATPQPPQGTQCKGITISRNMRRAGWKISGPGGAAELLGLKPSTLAYRLAQYGIKRNRT